MTFVAKTFPWDVCETKHAALLPESYYSHIAWACTQMVLASTFWSSRNNHDHVSTYFFYRGDYITSKEMKGPIFTKMITSYERRKSRPETKESSQLLNCYYKVSMTCSSKSPYMLESFLCTAQKVSKFILVHLLQKRWSYMMMRGVPSRCTAVKGCRMSVVYQHQH